MRHIKTLTPSPHIAQQQGKWATLKAGYIAHQHKLSTSHIEVKQYPYTGFENASFLVISLKE